jgi:hypothetical protein
MQPLSKYSMNATGGSPNIRPASFFAPLGSVKEQGEKLIREDPIGFFEQLQAAVESPLAPPLSPYEQKLSGRFKALFDKGNTQTAVLGAAVQKAFALIVNEYMTHTGPTNWTHYTNLGRFDGHVLERAAAAAFAQMANTAETALYYNAFKDISGKPLEGRDPSGYVITFRPEQIPHPRRFWSVSAYTREAEHVIRNGPCKYNVANCTPGLRANDDGSLSIYLAKQLPEGVPSANWLPIGRGEFTLWLRIYGPETSANETYIPPGIISTMP